VIFIVLLVVAVLRRSRSVIAAPAVFVLAVAVGIAVAPLPPGGTKTVAASATLGTPENPTAYFSGSVRCEWMVGDEYVTNITGFDLEVSEPVVLVALDLPGPATIDRLFVGGAGRPGPVVALEYSAGAEPNSGSFSPLDLTDLGLGGRTGTAAAGTAVVVSWTCSSGPEDTSPLYPATGHLEVNGALEASVDVAGTCYMREDGVALEMERDGTTVQIGMTPDGSITFLHVLLDDFEAFSGKEFEAKPPWVVSEGVARPTSGELTFHDLPNTRGEGTISGQATWSCPDFQP
ncbi:MAG: hypothetical protein MUQ32_17010, partial [Chloroflexi bacterium]|nr:hypothetical protein [Chloroflexota bacterium]